MALSKDYEIPNTGVTVPNAYFVLGDTRVEKRHADFAYPGMDLTDEERVAKGEPLVNFKAGRIAWIGLSVYASEAAKNEGKKPIGTIGGDNSKEFRCFVESGDLDPQIYTYLKTTDYFSDAVDA